jgi:hypothetical protein
VSDITVHFARNEIDAEVAAGALRANRLHPRVVRDPLGDSLGIGGRLYNGRCVVLVPETEARAAREILREPRRRGR